MHDHWVQQKEILITSAAEKNNKPKCATTLKLDDDPSDDICAAHSSLLDAQCVKRTASNADVSIPVLKTFPLHSLLLMIPRRNRIVWRLVYFLKMLIFLM